MKEITKEWIEKAEGDFRTAYRESNVTEGQNYDAICFHAQQCIEKILKAILIENNIVPDKTHDLAYLNQILIHNNLNLKLDLNDLRLLTRAAVEFRYPGEVADYEEAMDSLKICIEIRNILLDYVNKNK